MSDNVVEQKASDGNVKGKMACGDNATKEEVLGRDLSEMKIVNEDEDKALSTYQEISRYPNLEYTRLGQVKILVVKYMSDVERYTSSKETNAFFRNENDKQIVFSLNNQSNVFVDFNVQGKNITILMTDNVHYVARLFCIQAQHLPIGRDLSKIRTLLAQLEEVFHPYLLKLSQNVEPNLQKIVLSKSLAV